MAGAPCPAQARCAGPGRDAHDQSRAGSETALTTVFAHWAHLGVPPRPAVVPVTAALRR